MDDMQAVSVVKERDMADNTNFTGLQKDDMVMGCWPEYFDCHSWDVDIPGIPPNTTRKCYELMKPKKYISKVGFCQDYWFFIANSHPLLGIFLCHPYHPWSKGERFIMLVVATALTLVPSALMIWLVHKENELITGDDKATNRYHLDELAVLCCVTIPVMMCNALMYQLAVADARCLGSNMKCCAQVMQKVKSCMFFWLSVFSFFTAAFGIGFACMVDIHLGKLALSTLRSTLQRWILWFPIYFFMPCSGFLHGWCKERDEFLEHGDVADQDHDDAVVSRGLARGMDSEDSEYEDDESEEEEGCC